MSSSSGKKLLCKETGLMLLYMIFKISFNCSLKENRVGGLMIFLRNIIMRNASKKSPTLVFFISRNKGTEEKEGSTRVYPFLCFSLALFRCPGGPRTERTLAIVPKEAPWADGHQLFLTSKVF